MLKDTASETSSSSPSVAAAASAAATEAAVTAPSGLLNAFALSEHDKALQRGDGPGEGERGDASGTAVAGRSLFGSIRAFVERETERQRGRGLDGSGSGRSDQYEKTPEVEDALQILGKIATARLTFAKRSEK